MSAYQLLLHESFDESLQDLPLTTQRKAVWAQVLLGTRGRTPIVKGTAGRNARWRRTPVQGNHYYMWWIPQSESPLADATIDISGDLTDGNGGNGADAVNTILVHSVRHHDRTDEPIRTGSLTEYRAVPVASLDPRFDEQKAVSAYLTADDLAVVTIKGLPGSGKTVALLYLLRDLIDMPGDGRILYVTYTRRLKRAAREFVESQYTGADRTRLERIHIATLDEVLHDLTGIFSLAEPFGEMDEFYAFLERQNPADLGPWRKYPRTLFTELRAFLLGQDFPDSYDWAQSNRGGGGIDLDAYAQERGLDRGAAEVAYQLAQRVRHMRFFRDQIAARRALAALATGRTPDWVRNLDALVIDEVQDLTLLQIACLTELVRARLRQRPAGALRFALAGDESQIVQPSGFDWGMTKYLAGEQLNVWPDEFDFEHQRRSPDNLAQLIDNTWTFYGHLPKPLRPSARSERAVDGAPTQGRIYVCPVPAGAAAQAQVQPLRELFTALERPLPADPATETPADFLWATLLAEVADRPGRALVDLTERLHTALAGVDVPAMDEILFLPRQIKGLERTTILIHGLNEVYTRALALCDDKGDGNIPRFEARRLFDEVRVALSRSTDNLILLEAPDAPVLQELQLQAIDGVQRVTWTDLIETLQMEEMSELEAIEGYLREVDDLFEREKWEQAFARNRRAHAMAVRLGDRALQREADVQRVNGMLLQADTHLYREQWAEAHARNQAADRLAAPLRDRLLRDRITEQRTLIGRQVAAQVERHLAAAQEAIDQQRYPAAHDAAQAGYALAALADDASLHRRAVDTAADTAWQWAAHLVSRGEVTEIAGQVAGLLGDAAAVMDADGNAGSAEALRVLQARYRELPVSHELSEEQVLSLLELAERYMDVTGPLHAEPEAYVFIRRWLQEAYGGLEDRVTLFYAWASAAVRLGRLTGDASYRTQVVHLEQRLASLLERAGPFSHLWDNNVELARFRALAAGVHGQHAEASATWEALGDPEQAAWQARQAGDMERAFALLRQAKLPVSEDLATTVKFLRLLDQIEQKEYPFSPGEKRMLIDRLAALQARLEEEARPGD
ncbi:MAG: AAA family ATPase [Caldilineaceae bacterium]|nr:AAA family ATPase [Caldilineaceae bacterium]